MDENMGPALWNKVSELEQSSAPELINRITIDSDDVTTVSITADVNGKGFKIQEVALRISAPANTTIADANLFLYDAVTAGKRILGFSERVANTAASEFRLWAKKYPYGYDARKATNTSNIANLIDPHSGSSDFVRCVRIDVYSNTFANGTVIELWGVRA